MEKKTRNGYVDLLRFLASYVIVFFHLGIAPYYTRDGILGKLPGGALFVEFFFMLSGYFAAKVFIEADKGKEPVIHRFMLKKYLRFLPYSFLTAVVMYTWTIFSKAHTFQSVIKMLLVMPFEVLLLRGTGIIQTEYIHWLWYLSAMVITLPIVLYLLKYHERIFKSYLAWSVPFFIYGYIINTIGTICTIDWLLSTLRALAGLMLGASLVYVTRFIKGYRITKKMKTVLTVIELCAIGSAFYYCKIYSLAASPYDITFIPMVYISLSITLSGKTWTSCIHGKVFSFLGKISLPIYCIHPVIYRVIRYFIPDASRELELILTTVGTFVAACLMQAIVDHIILPLAKVVRAKAEACREPELVQSK